MVSDDPDGSYLSFVYAVDRRISFPVRTLDFSPTMDSPFANGYVMDGHGGINQRLRRRKMRIAQCEITTHDLGT